MNRHSHRFTRSILTQSAVVLAVAASARVLAQEAIEEIVVTADFRASTLNDIPASITVLTPGVPRLRCASPQPPLARWREARAEVPALRAQLRPVRGSKMASLGAA